MRTNLYTQSIIPISNLYVRQTVLFSGEYAIVHIVWRLAYHVVYKCHLQVFTKQSRLVQDLMLYRVLCFLDHTTFMIIANIPNIIIFFRWVGIAHKILSPVLELPIFFLSFNNTSIQIWMHDMRRYPCFVIYGEYLLILCFRSRLMMFSAQIREQHFEQYHQYMATIIIIIKRRRSRRRQYKKYNA